MSYATFLLLFIILPAVVLAVIQPRPLAGVGGLRATISLPLVALIAFIYTTPWDNYLVYRDVWSYGQNRVIAVIGFVPIEEYCFFLLQPLLTGLFLYRVLAINTTKQHKSGKVSYFTGVLLFAALTFIGVALLISGWDHGLYLGLILAWASPVLLGMWIYAGQHFWQFRYNLLLALAIPTLYLWIADWIAIKLGIWDISNQYSLNVDPLGLPLEEAVFFLMTNLLVIMGALLFLHGDQIYDKRISQKSLTPY